MPSTDLLQRIAAQRAQMEMLSVSLFERAKADGIDIPDDVLKALCRLEAKRLVREERDAH